MTRVLISVQNLPVTFDRRVWLECQALVSDGYQVAVVCPKGNGDPAQLGCARSSRERAQGHHNVAGRDGLART